MSLGACIASLRSSTRLAAKQHAPRVEGVEGLERRATGVASRVAGSTAYTSRILERSVTIPRPGRSSWFTAADSVPRKGRKGSRTGRSARRLITSSPPKSEPPSVRIKAETLRGSSSHRALCPNLRISALSRSSLAKLPILLSAPFATIWLDSKRSRLATLTIVTPSRVLSSA